MARMSVLTTKDLYHTNPPDCQGAGVMGTVAETDGERMSKQQAEKRGLDPCPTCFPEEG